MIYGIEMVIRVVRGIVGRVLTRGGGYLSFTFRPFLGGAMGIGHE